MKLSITGMDVIFPGCENLELFELGIYRGNKFSGAISKKYQNSHDLLLKVLAAVLEDGGFSTKNLAPSKIALLLTSDDIPAEENRNGQISVDPSGGELRSDDIVAGIKTLTITDKLLTLAAGC